MVASTVGPGSDIVELADVQALVFFSHKNHLHAAFIPITFHDRTAAGAWLAALGPKISRCSEDGRLESQRIQVALSGAGLRRLGLPPDTLDAMPQELMEGMASRARVLGDLVDDLDRPTGWTVPEIHALLIVYAKDPAARDKLAKLEIDTLPPGVVAGPPEISDALKDREHFGFADGLSQPYVIGQPADRKPGQDAIRTGEIVLGYRNAYGRYPESARLPGVGLPDDDLGRNGTFLVFRKLEQRVGAFWKYFDAQARALGGDATAEWLAAKAMGRWPNGTSLAHAWRPGDVNATPPGHINDIHYEPEDAHGLRCPIASHVRRANPRDSRGGTREESLQVSNRHRIVRRGRSYGGAALSVAEAIALPDDQDGARGLYFVSVGASIARGFEFIQQTWLTNVGFRGLHCEPDVVAGGGEIEAKQPRRLTIPQDPVRLCLHDVPRFVYTRGGEYTFVPGLRALAAIARWAVSPP